MLPDIGTSRARNTYLLGMVANKVCSKCSKMFGCNALSGNCWCDNLPSLGRPMAEWTDCLCPACLEKEIEMNSVLKHSVPKG
jgi:hypothetical protein